MMVSIILALYTTWSVVQACLTVLLACAVLRVVQLANADKSQFWGMLAWPLIIICVLLDIIIWLI